MASTLAPMQAHCPSTQIQQGSSQAGSYSRSSSTQSPQSLVSPGCRLRTQALWGKLGRHRCRQSCTQLRTSTECKLASRTACLPTQSLQGSSPARAMGPSHFQGCSSFVEKTIFQQSDHRHTSSSWRLRTSHQGKGLLQGRPCILKQQRRSQLCRIQEDIDRTLHWCFLQRRPHRMGMAGTSSNPLLPHPRCKCLQGMGYTMKWK